MANNFRFPTAAAWSFNAGRFNVSLFVERARNYVYDGDDEGGETQAALDSGALVAFDSNVVVTLDGDEIGSDMLCGSVYAADSVPEFWTAHRDPDDSNRNTLENKARNVVIGHYFPDMVANAIEMARDTIRNRPAAPYVRVNAR